MKKIQYCGFNIAIIIIILLMAGCKKYLQKTSSTSIVTPQSLSDLQALLDDGDNMNTLVTPSLGEAAADDYFQTLATYNARPDYLKQSYTWQPFEYIAPNDWSKAYSAIYVSNFCLDQLSVIGKGTNTNEWNNVKGSAYFFRAYYFLNLLWIYGKAYDEETSDADPGIALRTQSDFNIPSSRASVQESFSQILNDIRQSILYLPDLPIHPMRPSKCAAYALMARTYLSLRNYDSVYKYANLSLNLKNTLLDYNDATVSASANVPFQPFNNEIVFFTSMYQNPNISTSLALIDTTLYASYNDNDLRKNVFFRANGTYMRFKGSYASHSSRLFSGIAVDEVLLMRAECLARFNQIDSAMSDLNLLLQKRWNKSQNYTPLSTSSVNETLQLILNERRKELVMRGLRWPDIKRLNKEGYNLTLKRLIGDEIFQLIPNSNMYALPLPKDIIEQSEMKQNIY
ncbi:MAG: RagB/SusD family nutrient uptake outer membrane protein [Niabella sp.]